MVMAQCGKILTDSRRVRKDQRIHRCILDSREAPKKIFDIFKVKNRKSYLCLFPTLEILDSTSVFRCLEKLRPKKELPQSVVHCFNATITLFVRVQFRYISLY